MASETPQALKENPLTLGAPKSLLPQPCLLVIFGAAGDLSWRKLMPAVYNLNVDGLLPASLAVVGFGIGSQGDPDEWIRARARDGLNRFSRRELDEGHWAEFARALFYVEGSFNDARAYEQLKARLAALDQQFGVPGSRVYYLSIPPTVADMCVSHLKSAGMVSDPSDSRTFTRVIVEKPIGRDLESARKVNASLARSFHESQIYRIDHYLGKETVQNLLVLRFANSIFEPLWNQKYIDHVQITVAEDEGVASRVGYYEGVGALRDMVQNHMLQLVCLAAMEPPWSNTADVTRDYKLAILNCLRPIAGKDVEKYVVRAQYGPGYINGADVPGYRRENGVKPDSTTDTYVAMKVFIDNWRWAGVPFYLRTGKRLPKRASEIAVQFKEVPEILYNVNPETPLEPNVLALRIQPDEGLSLRISAKLPGPKVRIYPVKMDFQYLTTFGGQTPEAYERLLLDVMAGDATLFMRRDAVETSWRWVTNILNAWKESGNRWLPEYAAGTWGPLEADKLIHADGRKWRTL